MHYIMCTQDKKWGYAMDLGEILSKQIFFVILGAIISGIILGYLSSSLHSQKGYDGGFWMGFFLGIVGLIYAAGLPDLNVISAISRIKKQVLQISQNNNKETYKVSNTENCSQNNNNKETYKDSNTENCKDNIKNIEKTKTVRYTNCPVCGCRVYDDEEYCCSCGYEM